MHPWQTHFTQGFKTQLRKIERGKNERGLHSMHKNDKLI